MTQGNDLPDAVSMYNALKRNSGVQLHFVPESAIEDVDDELPLRLPGIPGTMAVRQLIYAADGNVIQYRNLSCFCKWPDTCDCFGIKSRPISAGVGVDLPSLGLDVDHGQAEA